MQLWLRPDLPDRHADSIAKLIALLQGCDELGVDTSPVLVSSFLRKSPSLSLFQQTMPAHKTALPPLGVGVFKQPEVLFSHESLTMPVAVNFGCLP